MSYKVEQIRKKMLYILRHAAVKKGLHVCPDGYVRVDDLLTLRDFYGVCSQDVEFVCVTCDVPLFSFVERDGVLLVRANQGHSFTLEPKKICRA